MLESSQVTIKPRIANAVDLISDFPESVICHILSRLPTKDAVRTTILSRDWEYKWTSIYNVDIDDYRFRYGESKKREIFMDFVDKILFLSHDLKSFRLVCHRKYDPIRLTLWISTVLRRNIESFELRLDLPKYFVLPRIFNNNTSLKKLTVISPCTLKVQLNNHFPNLTSLYLENVEILNMLSNSEPLVFTLPVLKTLELVACKWSNVNVVEIYSPLLSMLKCSTNCEGGVNSYSVKICGARLENFITSGGYPENFIFHESVVHKAYLRNHPQNSDLKSGLHIRRLLKGVSTVTILVLSTSLYKVIARSDQELPLPRYDMLQRLHIGLSDNAKLLFEFLHSTPSLKYLCIAQDRRGSKPFDPDEVYHVPCCVKSHLEKIVFSRVDEKALFHLAMFFLKHGVKLKIVSLINYDCPKALAVKLSKFSRASAYTQIY